MNKTFVARAPGKLFLLGEYAVLDGAPAVVAAVDRHVEVRLEVQRSRRVTRIAAPGHCEPLELTAAGLESAPLELRFALAAIAAATRKLPPLADCGLDLEIRSGLESGAEAGHKLGLGGSAAVSAAIVAAMYAAAGRDLPSSLDEIFATAFTAHREAQSGLGSGADIAASVYGGVLLFQPQAESLPRVRPLFLPPRVRFLAAWSGKAAATAPLVRRYLALEDGVASAPVPATRAAVTTEPRPVREVEPRCVGGGEAARHARSEFVQSARASVGSFVRALDSGWLSARSLNDSGEALEQIARDGDLPLLTPELQHIVSLARAAGAGAKLSGAGGGDCAIALTHDDAVADRVHAAWRGASIRILELRLASGGVSVAQT